MFRFIRNPVGFFLGVVSLLLLYSSCSNEIDLNFESDPVPVVWCLLNPDVNEQFVRLGRSYLSDPADPGAAPVTDSTVWNLDVVVYVEEWADGMPARVFRFEPAAAQPKDSGYFPADNIRLYKSGFTAKRGTEYRLYVHFPDDDRIVTGTTIPPQRPVVYDPLEIPGRKINLQTGVQFTSRWAPGEGNGVFQGEFVINYQDSLSGEVTHNQVIIRMSPILSLGQEIEITDLFSGNRFLEEMVRQVPVKQAVVRDLINVQYRLFKGGEELALLVSPDLQETTISNTLNQYTNLVNATGVFSSIQITSVNNLQLSNTTVNELAHSELTQQLGFRDIHGGEM
ncbi:MAG TPA: hypothetical protein DC042_14770 [Bacteroidales bacterium]|nr:hypothetical protein [Bacteroidales bacterium]